MSWTLHYGAGATLDLTLPDSTVTDFSMPHGAPAADPVADLVSALEKPLDFPPLTRAVVPDDRVALALDRTVPRLPEVVSAVVRCLLGSEQPPGQITLVYERGELAEPIADLPPEIASQVEHCLHDPSDKSQHCYLAASEDGKPIYLNRALCEADVVIPISTARLEAGLGYRGAFGGLFPNFSDDATQHRFFAPSSHDWATLQRRRRKEADEAAWLLGVPFTIQVTPGAGNTIYDVAAGEAQAVAAASSRSCQQAWMHQAEERAGLVIATIEGGPDHQTWDNFARSIYAASRAVSDGGALLICTELSGSLGPAFQRLIASGDDARALHDIRRDRSRDAIAAVLLAEALTRIQVFLLSRLDGDSVEDLGVGHVSSAAEVERLGKQFSTCILLGNAQHAFLELDNHLAESLRHQGIG